MLIKLPVQNGRLNSFWNGTAAFQILFLETVAMFEQVKENCTGNSTTHGLYDDIHTGYKLKMKYFKP